MQLRDKAHSIILWIDLIVYNPCRRHSNECLPARCNAKQFLALQQRPPGPVYSLVTGAAKFYSAIIQPVDTTGSVLCNWGKSFYCAGL